YDPTFVADELLMAVEGNTLPRVGVLNLTAGGALPVGVDTFTDDGFNKVMQAVYIVNGGNCSPVIEFNPKLQWQFEQGIKAVGNIDPNSGKAIKQDGVVKANWPIVGGRGQLRKPVAAADVANRMHNPGEHVQATLVKQQAAFILANSIQAELRV